MIVPQDPDYVVNVASKMKNHLFGDATLILATRWRQLHFLRTLPFHGRLGELKRFMALETLSSFDASAVRQEAASSKALPKKKNAADGDEKAIAQIKRVLTSIEITDDTDYTMLYIQLSLMQLTLKSADPEKHAVGLILLLCLVSFCVSPPVV